MTQDHLSVDEVSSRLRVGVLQVYDLFGELNDLFRVIHQMLRESETDIHPLSSKGFLLPKDRKTSRPADRFMRTDMGLIAEIGIDDDEEEEETVDAEELEDEGADDDDNDKTSIAITPERRFLGVRAILIDPKDKAHGPTVVAGTFGSLTLTPRVTRNVAPTAQSSFKLRRAALKRMVKLLEPGVPAGRTASDKVRQGQLAWTVTALHCEPLASFGAKTDVDRFVERIAAMVVEGGVVNSARS